MLCHALGVFYSSFSIAGNAQTTTIFQAKFGWTEDETMFYNTIISASAIVGMFVGCICAGKLIQKGRRRGAVIANSLAIIGAGTTMVGTIPFLALGRFSNGVAAGIYNVTFSKMVLENMPTYLSQKLAMCQSASIQVGVFAAYSMGGILPDPKDTQACKEDELWRVIYLVPAFIGTFELIIALLIFRLEPIAYCVMMGLEEEGMQHMRRVYRKVDPDSPETIDEILEMQYQY